MKYVTENRNGTFRMLDFNLGKLRGFRIGLLPYYHKPLSLDVVRGKGWQLNLWRLAISVCKRAEPAPAKESRVEARIRQLLSGK